MCTQSFQYFKAHLYNNNLIVGQIAVSIVISYVKQDLIQLIEA